MEQVMILLPQEIDFIKNVKNNDICIDKEEYSVYFRNIIYPFSENYDIQVDCPYGRNLGNCWRIDTFPDETDEFELKISVYAPFGKCLAQGSTTVKLYEKGVHDELKLLCIGDSMTLGETYVNQAASKAKNVKTLGTRQVKQPVWHEGRGGWRCCDYLQMNTDSGKGVSPFLFPKGCAAEKYFGDKTFHDRLMSEELKNGYTYFGCRREEIQSGMYVHECGRLLRCENGDYTLADENIEFEFSFEKYLKRYGVPVPDVVSLLFGANEFQLTLYENAENEIKSYIESLKQIISSVKETDPSIKIVVNLPVPGSEQYAWGMQLGCRGNAKRYDYIIKLATRALMAEFDGRRDENIYICPMLAAIDPDVGYASGTACANIYSEKTQLHQVNWVHPNISGYKQMGDALAGTLAAIRSGR